jgi:hypothetical protein
MTLSVIPIQFPPGEILDRDGFVWVTLPPSMRIAQLRIHGVCSCDPLALRLVQVTVERDDRKIDLLSPGRDEPFPLAVGFPVVVPDVQSTSDVPVRITVHVRRSHGARRDEHGRLTSLPDPARFHLVLVARGVEEMSA